MRVSAAEARHRKETQERMPRIRQQNVLAAQWTPNGGALGAPDLTLSDNQIFGISKKLQGVKPGPNQYIWWNIHEWSLAE